MDQMTSGVTQGKSETGEATNLDWRPVVGQSRATSPRRIAHILLWPQIGGGEIATLRVARGLEEGGEFQSVAFCHGEHTEVARLFAEHRIETTTYSASDYSYRRAAPFVASAIRLAGQLRRRRIDLVHCSDMAGAYHAGLAARLARIPIVCHIRSNFEQIPLRYKPPLLTIDRFAFVSQATWQNFNNIFHVPPDRGSVIYDWAPATVPPADHTRVRDRIRNELGIALDAPVFGMVARVAPQKDFETLIAAAADIMTVRPDARLLLVGENTEPEDCHLYHQQLCNLSDRMGLNGRLTWTGFRSDVPDLMLAMDVVVLSTRSEGFPLTLLEAMSLGRPVVTTRVGGIPEIVVDGENGLLHEPGDARGLGRQILRLLEDTELACGLSSRGRESVLQRFTKDRTLGAIKRVYVSLLSRGANGGSTERSI
jgi:glycosyltransferase involved in cell wall biosynthesis